MSAKPNTALQIDNKAFYRTVATLVIPMALQNLINVGVTSLDVVMLGMVGEEVLSASSLAGQVQFVMTLIFFGLASGASVLTAQYWGKGDIRTIEKVMAIAIRLAFLCSLVFFALAELIPEQLMRIFTTDEALIPLGVSYLRWLAPSFIIISFTNLYLNILRSVEKVLVPAIVYGCSLVANAIFNAVLIFGLLGFPALGIVGAAIATTLARVLELVIVLVYNWRNKLVKLHMKDFFARHKTLFGDFSKYAIPTTLNEMLWGMAVSASTVIIGRMGSAAVAANSVAQVTRQLATVVSFGVAAAAAILIGKAIGAGEPEKAFAYAKKMLKMSLGTGLAGCVVILILRPAILRLMNLSPQASEYLGFLLYVMAAYVIAQAMAACNVVGIFRGGGDTRFGLFLDGGVMWLYAIPAAALAAFVFGAPVEVVFLVILSDEFVKVPICLWRFASRRWLRNVTREQVD